ncbi:arylalkylamine N-acetyltransferase 1-like [Anthonomus grandis grandis]|uniref:arylalkylamine N-acetyltransferase 1-like n=1 Tax=Anthonomus grandis grandis TaxID=2921223 RepID=UPI002166030D|nr:arylalkylamine N-acetyltransferase 1-like [Anthonomus grandis grandis]XP_050303267.1 arylalkylamine N-acetyltransferase 1-like [Anthonomus grandis grandis]XP_050303268.1 arylalkylamine N-acetyltransferase 1-like [Anthonomus grandis grandis]
MLEYVIVPKSRFSDVIDHLRVSFPDEPLNAAVGLALHGIPCPLLEHHELKTLEDGMSLMAVDRNMEKIAGVALNGVSNKGDTEKSIEETNAIENLQYRRIFGLLNDVNMELDLFSKYNVDKIFDIRILSVDSNYRGKGIAKDLFMHSEAIARKNGFKLMKTDATSLFTQRVAESQGFWVEKSVNYHDYMDENGKKIYDTQPPHLDYKVMAKLLD